MNRLTPIAIMTGCMLASCQCGPVTGDLDGGPDGSIEAPPIDSGVAMKPTGPSPDTVWPTTFASEPCPAEAFGLGLDGGITLADGGLRLGICIALHTLTADAFLDGKPETEPVTAQFIGGNFRSELARVPNAQGVFQVKVMRGRYDSLQHQSGGVWPFAKGFIEHGYADMTQDIQRDFRATSHLLRGGVHFGGLPFTPNIFPQDVWFEGFGTPVWQTSMVTSQGGSYELRMLEGTFVLYLSTPARSLFGTELQKFSVTPKSQLNFDRDQELDINIATSVLEASITIDGEPLPDSRTGPDFAISYTRAGDGKATVISRHEGGLANLTALIPKGLYGASFDFEGLPNRTFPSRIFGKALQRGLDLNNDATFAVNLETRIIEGGLLIDGVAPAPNPNVNLRLYLLGMSGQTDIGSSLLYEIPRESSSFFIKVFPGNYLTILRLDEELADDLATGFWVIDRYLQVQTNRSMPISIETSRFTGRITIDGQVPVPHQPVGVLSFRNRALEGEYSWFMKHVVAGEDGSFAVKLPKGEYEVFFTIDSDTYPEHASGRQRIFSRVPLATDAVLDIDYPTIEINGPLRVGGEKVPDTISGPEVGLRLRRQEDFQSFEWHFEGGAENYRLRVPQGAYSLDFVIYQNAFDGVAWGDAPMGLHLNVAQPGEPFMNFTR